MKDVQENHLDYIKRTAIAMIDAKYRKGAEEHKTILSEDYNASQLVDFAIEEAIDQITYLLTLKEAIDGKRI